MKIARHRGMKKAIVALATVQLPRWSKRCSALVVVAS
jgi:hypothetical protein